MNYRVEWLIDVFDVNTPEEAARVARDCQTTADTIATVFDVYEHERDSVRVRVDLVNLDTNSKP